MIRCFALLVVLLSAALGAAAPAGARVMQTGIADDAVLLDGGAEADQAVAQWRDMGIDVVRGGAARQQDRIVGDPGLHHARAGRRRGAEGGREQHDEQCGAPDHKL